MFLNLDHSKIASFLRCNVDWIIWKRNPLHASHIAGIWERQIRSARLVCNGILLTHSKSLTDESFRTILCKVKCVLIFDP